MAASSSTPVPQATSTTSSGFADGLGRRVLAFDREEGVMLERLLLRPELGAFEAALRERVDRIGTLEDERLARPRTIEREPNGGLAVVSEFVPGSRLSDLLETSADLGNVPGVDAALGFLLDVVPALCGLHAGARFAHGTITPSRTVLTPAGQIVLLDGIYGEALSRLRYSRQKLWMEFGVATAPSAGAPRLDVSADVAQSALAAVMLMLGRPLRADEYLSNLPGVLQEVIDVAQIRSTPTFADGLQDFLRRALSPASQAPYSSADDALFDIRQLASELGVQVCRRALVDFIEQMESPSSAAPVAEYDPVAEEIAAYSFDRQKFETRAVESPEQDLAAGVDAELDLDSLVEETPYEVDADESIVIEPAASAGMLDDEAVDWVQLAAAPEPPAVTSLASDIPAAAPPRETAVVAPQIDVEAAVIPPPLHAAPTPAPMIATPPEPASEPTPEPPALVTDAAALADLEKTGDAAEAETAVADLPSVRSRRAKRVNRWARARKDKLRSASEQPEPPAIVAAKPAPPEPKKATSSGSWLVAPGRAAAFDPPVPDMPAVAPAAPPVPVPPVAVTSGVFTPPPVAQYSPPPPPGPVYPAPSTLPLYTPPPSPPPPAPLVPVEPSFSRTVGAIAPSYSTPPAWTPPVPSISSSPQIATLRLKDPEPRPRGTRAPEVIDIYSSAPTPVAASEPTAFPWKLAGAAAVIMVVAIIGGRVYLPAKGVTPDATTATEPATVPTATAAAPPIASSAAASGGRLEIETQPAGARILLDGKPAGESPVALDGIAAGRHTVTFMSGSGSVKRTIRIEAGRTTRLDVPIFSGWVGIYAPFVVEVAEEGKVIGTTEDPRILLSPGKHNLTLVNRELGYTSAQAVDIEPGEVKSISIDPRGTVNLNALPWAEVWVDGRKAGDTPIANLQLPLGIREVIFRHPQLGERRVTITVKGNTPAAVSIDMNKPQP